MITNSNSLQRVRRSHADRLTVNLPARTLTALKIHVATRKKTSREVVTDLITKELEGRMA